jgi:hypothetical protein
MKKTRGAVDKIRSALNSLPANRFGMITFALAFGLFGVWLLNISHAATPAVSVEAENGTISASASSLADSTASGGHAVKFSGASSGTCPVSTLNAADGPDGMGGCWPGPLTTGVPSGVTLSAYTGSDTITTDNTVIDSKLITGDLVIKAKNVMIKNSKVSNGEVMIDTDSMPSDTAWSATIQDSEIDAGGPKHISNGTPCVNGETNAVCNARSGISAGNFTIRRVNVHGGQTAIQCDMDNHGTLCDVQDTWLHGQLNGAKSDAIPWHLGGSLSDGMKAGASYRFVHNRAACDWPVNAMQEGCTGDFNMISNFAPIHDVHAEANYFVGGKGLSYCTYGGFKSFTGHDIVYMNNVFQKTATTVDGTTNVCGAYGPVTDFVFGWTGNLWLNNKYDDGTPITCTAADECR